MREKGRTLLLSKFSVGETFFGKIPKFSQNSKAKGGNVSPPSLMLFVFVGELPADAEFVGDDAVKSAPGRFDGIHLHMAVPAQGGEPSAELSFIA